MRVLSKTKRIDPESCGELEDYLVKLFRHTKVVKGGRRFHFAAFVVVGNKSGVVGIGYGKANEIPDAIRKATENAKRNLIRIHIKNGTIAHEVKGKFCASRVWMKPASPGTGIIAGRNIRAVLEYAGIHNILTKTYFSRNTMNASKAAFECLKNLLDVRELADSRDRRLDEIFQ